MRKIFTVIIYKAMLVIILFSSASVFSQCIIIHTSNVTSNSANSSTPIVFAQSFVASCSGNLQYFELISVETGPISPGTFKIYNGNSVSGSPVYTQSHPQLVITAAGLPIRFNVTGVAPLILDNQYTFEFTVDNVDFLYEKNGTYPDGIAFQDGGAIPEIDLLFSVSILDDLAVDDFKPTNKIIVYPNPSANFIKISGLINTVKYVIYNVLAQKIIAGSVAENEKIDIKNFPNGIYFLRLENGKSLKFIKE